MEDRLDIIINRRVYNYIGVYNLEVRFKDCNDVSDMVYDYLSKMRDEIRDLIYVKYGNDVVVEFEGKDVLLMFSDGNSKRFEG